MYSNSRLGNNTFKLQRRSVMSNRSLDNLSEQSNEASNQFYDNNIGAAFDHYK